MECQKGVQSLLSTSKRRKGVRAQYRHSKRQSFGSDDTYAGAAVLAGDDGGVGREIIRQRSGLDVDRFKRSSYRRDVVLAVVKNA